VSTQPTAENDAGHAIRYTNDAGVDVLVSVPWGLHSGNIPPPSIAFGSFVFRYAGTVIPPASGDTTEDRS
jgi:hypothetical protein